MHTKQTLKPNDKLTIAQKNEIKKATKLPLVVDDDCPSYSIEELEALEKLANEKRNARQKELISLRVDHESIAMAKAFGKGYTQLFSKLIYIGMRDPEILKKAL